MILRIVVASSILMKRRETFKRTISSASRSMLCIAVVLLVQGEKPYENTIGNVFEAIYMLQKNNSKWVASLLKQKRRRNASSLYEMRNSVLYKADALYVPKDVALRAKLLRLHYNDLMLGYFGPTKTVACLARKFF